MGVRTARARSALAALVVVVLAVPLARAWTRDEAVTVPADRISAVRTGADGRELLVAYETGSCAGPATVGRDESRTDVALVLRVAAPAGDCDAALRFATARVELDGALGARVLRVAGQVRQPFDGARLLDVPAPLCRERGEGGTPTTTWTRTYGSCGGCPDGASCPAPRESFSLTQGLPQNRAGYRLVGRPVVGGQRAALYERTRCERIVVWSAGEGQGEIELRSLDDCSDPRLASRAAFVAVAGDIAQGA